MLLSSLALLLFLLPLQAAPVQTDYVEAELVSEVASIAPAKPFTVALRLKMEPGWHTYWKNAGSSGAATEIAWKLPKGFKAGPIQWPVPHRIEMPPLVNFGFENEIHLLTEITPPAGLKPGSKVRLAAHAGWLVCKEICLPGEADVELELSVRKGTPAIDPKMGEVFSRARTELPRALSGWRFSSQDQGAIVALSVEPVGSADPEWSKGLYFFPDPEIAIDPNAAQTVRVSGSKVALEMRKAEYGSDSMTALRGVLVSERGWDKDGRVRGMLVDAPITPTTGTSIAPGATVPSRGLAAMVLFAFVGGLILNLMPCVFPVLSLKILGFVRQAGAGASHARAHGLVYAGGVIVSFWILAAILLALRSAGEEIGWGFQLQSPGFVAGMSFLFTALGLNLLGVFEWGGAFASAGASLASGSGFAGSFWSGVLATIVATPCTAPFMGAALGVAVTLPAFEAWLIFTALAAGLAAPYVVLSSFPALLRALPRPGAWMETFKQLMAFPLLAAAIWLVDVFGKLTDRDGSIRLFWALLAAGIAAWIWGRWGTPVRSSFVRITSAASALAIVAGSLAWVTAAPKLDTWEPYSATRLAALRAEGRAVFVDFTAAWCVTCQVNKRTTLHTQAVEDAFREKRIAALRADWTKKDPEITRALAEFGRNAVPFYVLYPPKPDAEPVILPEILTPGIVLEAVARL